MGLSQIITERRRSFLSRGASTCFIYIHTYKVNIREHNSTAIFAVAIAFSISTAFMLRVQSRILAMKKSRMLLQKGKNQKCLTLTTGDNGCRSTVPFLDFCMPTFFIPRWVFILLKIIRACRYIYLCRTDLVRTRAYDLR